MPALVKNRSKGTVLAQSVSAVYVAMAGLASIDVSGEKSETYPSVTLDGPAYKTNDASGYVDPPTIKASGFYDPAHATYTSFAGLVSAPVPTNFKITYTDAAPTSAIYPGTGFGLDKKVEPGKAVMSEIEIVTSGNPS
jgi:hypothetical protein